MFPEVIIGPIAIFLGVGVIIGRHLLPGLMRAALALFYGEPVADDAITPRAPLHLLIVGSVSVVMGCLLTGSGFFGW